MTNFGRWQKAISIHSILRDATYLEAPNSRAQGWGSGCSAIMYCIQRGHPKASYPFPCSKMKQKSHSASQPANCFLLRCLHSKMKVTESFGVFFGNAFAPEMLF